MTSPREVRRLPVYAIRVAIVALMLLALQLAPGRWVSTFAVAKPTDIADRLWEWISVDDVAYSAVVATTWHSAVGFVVGATLGFLVAALFFLIPALREAFESYVTLLYTVPRVTLLPLLILLLGTGWRSIVVFVAATSFFPVFYNTHQGFQGARENMIGALQVLGLSRIRILWAYVLPISRNYIASALLIVVPQAVLAAIVGEMLLSTGIGGLITLQKGLFDVVGLYAATALATAVGVLANTAVWRSSRRAMRHLDDEAPTLEEIGLK